MYNEKYATYIRRKSKGFTLIELSIVLVIISLIVGGIVGGKSLIHSADLNRIISDVTVYQTATNNFRLQYDALAGDFNEASDYWPGCDTGGSGPCSGNGDFVITTTAGTFQYERYRYWQHLSLAELIPEKYSGGTGVWGGLGIGNPDPKFNQCGFDMSPDDNYRRAGHWLVLARNVSGSYQGGCVVPKDAKSIDKKMDDGDNSTGNVEFGNGSDYGTCNQYFSSNNVYLSTTDPACRMFFWMGNK